MTTWEIVGIVAALFLAALLGLALVGGFAYAVMMHRKTRAENRELIAVLKDLGESYKKATASYAEAPQLFKALGGIASRQVHETAKLSDAALKLAAIIGGSAGEGPGGPGPQKHYHAPATETEEAIAYQKMTLTEAGVDPGAAEQMAGEMFNNTGMVG